MKRSCLLRDFCVTFKNFYISVLLFFSFFFLKFLKRDVVTKSKDRLFTKKERSMTSINTNVGALNARLYALTSTDKQQTAMERLSSGLRVNSAADDAAGLAVAGKMESQLRGINMAIRNNQDAIGLIQTAEAGINEIRNMVLRIRELAVQMANGIYEDTPDRDNAHLEVTALIDRYRNFLSGCVASLDIYSAE